MGEVSVGCMRHINHIQVRARQKVRIRVYNCTPPRQQKKSRTSSRRNWSTVTVNFAASASCVHNQHVPMKPAQHVYPAERCRAGPTFHHLTNGKHMCYIASLAASVWLRLARLPPPASRVRCSRRLRDTLTAAPGLLAHASVT